jgi:hypothetical protein
MDGPCGNSPLDQAALGGPVNVGRYFAASIFGPFFSQDIFEFETSEQAALAFDTVISHYGCGEWTEREPLTGMDVHYVVEEMDFPDLGDSTVALSISMRFSTTVQAGVQLIQQPARMEDPFEDMSLQIILARQSQRLMMFTHFDFIDHGGLNLEETIALAVARSEPGQ